MMGDTRLPNWATKMQRQSYQAVARKLRHYADLIDANALRSTPQQKRTLSQALHNASLCASRADAKHSGYTWPKPCTHCRKELETNT